jgi:hypothetical protein
MASLRQQLRERLDYLDQATRERVIADALGALDRPTVLMVDQGARVLADERFDARRGYAGGMGDRDLVEVVFRRMVDAVRNGA